MNPIAHLSAEATLLGIYKTVKNESGIAKRVAAFLGIPYAEPPINSRRFAPPVASKLWHGERSATKLGPFCPQDLKSMRATYFPIPIEDNMSEDCLYMNIWTPTVNNTAHLPVMVWIYGGAFIQGCSDYFDGTALAGRQDIVYVSFNYRVGAFGFMSMNDDRIRGNMGFLDQVEALRWIQRHITSFGGDPRNVTLFGESAGSISISLMLTSPLVRGQGLFQRAIMQSGTCFYYSCCWSAEDAKKYSVGKLKRMGAKNITSGKDVVEFLQNKSSKEIVSAMGLGMLPCVDGSLITTRLTCSLYQSGQFEPVELIIGFNAFEGASFIRQFLTTVPELNVRVAEEYLKVLVYKSYFRHHPRADVIHSLLYEEYLKGVTEHEALHRALVEVFGDLLFVPGTIANALAHSKRARTYMYLFDHRPFFSQYPEWITADHGNEIPYVVGEPYLGRVPADLWDQTEQNLSNTLMKYWTNFARTGDPNGADLPTWPIYNSTSREMICLGPVHSLCSNHNPTRMSLWLDRILGPDLETNVHAQL